MKASSSICSSGLPSLRWPVTRNSGPPILLLWKYWRPADLARNWKISLRPASLMMKPSSACFISCFCCSSGAKGAAALGPSGAAGGWAPPVGAAPEAPDRSGASSWVVSEPGISADVSSGAITGSIKGSAGVWAWRKPAARTATEKVRIFAAFMIVVSLAFGKFSSGCDFTRFEFDRSVRAVQGHAGRGDSAASGSHAHREHVKLA